MLNKALICIVMLAFVFGCANQQKDTEEKPAEETQQTEAAEQPEAAEQAEQPEATEQTQEAEIAGTIEEVSLTVNGMTWGNCVSAVQSALAQVTGVTEVVSVSQADSKAVVKVKKGEVKTDALVQAVEADSRFTAKVIE